ncbi:uncharacterized protein BDR25DRAFT_348555 [Lindgomyces ingoldianus]|uniref:Uncharacterized protein n=1 Tax=Lindgomyces ingoldianus TaxID=673940 RepID=A0ACB6RG09_9PLEO|nr:uncharacterized protein BDR25DRAFT_348555 [Lindgomyces ingoldianus]KAF2478294.1 hypothetical protein BDR25DRAFT_348555 [Lindgomyces ingoldianus]
MAAISVTQKRVDAEGYYYTAELCILRIRALVKNRAPIPATQADESTEHHCLLPLHVDADLASVSSFWPYELRAGHSSDIPLELKIVVVIGLEVIRVTAPHEVVVYGGYVLTCAPKPMATMWVILYANEDQLDKEDFGNKVLTGAWFWSKGPAVSRTWKGGFEKAKDFKDTGTSATTGQVLSAVEHANWFLVLQYAHCSIFPSPNRLILPLKSTRRTETLCVTQVVSVKDAFQYRRPPSHPIVAVRTECLDLNIIILFTTTDPTTHSFLTLQILDIALALTTYSTNGTTMDEIEPSVQKRGNLRRRNMGENPVQNGTGMLLVTFGSRINRTVKSGDRASPALRIIIENLSTHHISLRSIYFGSGYFIFSSLPRSTRGDLQQLNLYKIVLHGAKRDDPTVGKGRTNQYRVQTLAGGERKIVEKVVVTPDLLYTGHCYRGPNVERSDAKKREAARFSNDWDKRWWGRLESVSCSQKRFSTRLYIPRTHLPSKILTMWSSVISHILSFSIRILCNRWGFIGNGQLKMSFDCIMRILIEAYSIFHKSPCSMYQVKVWSRESYLRAFATIIRSLEASSECRSQGILAYELIDPSNPLSQNIADFTPSTATTSTRPSSISISAFVTTTRFHPFLIPSPTLTNSTVGVHPADIGASDSSSTGLAHEFKVVLGAAGIFFILLLGVLWYLQGRKDTKGQEQKPALIQQEGHLPEWANSSQQPGSPLSFSTIFAKFKPRRQGRELIRVSRSEGLSEWVGQRPGIVSAEAVELSRLEEEEARIGGQKAMVLARMVRGEVEMMKCSETTIDSSRIMEKLVAARVHWLAAHRMICALSVMYHQSRYQVAHFLFFVELDVLSPTRVCFLFKVWEDMESKSLKVPEPSKTNFNNLFASYNTLVAVLRGDSTATSASKAELTATSTLTPAWILTAIFASSILPPTTMAINRPERDSLQVACIELANEHDAISWVAGR